MTCILEINLEELALKLLPYIAVCDFTAYYNYTLIDQLI